MHAPHHVGAAAPGQTAPEQFASESAHVASAGRVEGQEVSERVDCRQAPYAAQELQLNECQACRSQAPTSLADMVMSALSGCQAAQHVLFDIRRGIAHPDALHAALQAELAQADSERLRGFMRELQKRLEATP